MKNLWSILGVINLIAGLIGSFIGWDKADTTSLAGLLCLVLAKLDDISDNM